MIRLIKYIFKVTGDGFYFICSTISKGFFYYFYAFCSLIEKFFDSLKRFFKKRQADPVASFIIIFAFIVGVFSYTYIFPSGNTVKIKLNKVEQEVTPKDENTSNKIDTNIETNLFRRFSSTSLDEINFDELRKTNSDVVSWIMVDGTNINYPIVKTTDNDYYLNHNINKINDSNGWTFMDYRNRVDLSDSNTIFYGHNLLNKTSFGSISNLFTNKWFKSSNHSIIVVNDNGKYIYQIFSVYYSEPVTDYLQTNFYSNSSYLEFLNNLKSKSKFDFEVELKDTDKIITLSTCTDDNKGRKVVHAKLVG